MCGKPMVSTNLPREVPLVNKDAKTGIVVSPKNSDALRETINALLANPVLKEKYGNYAKERVKKEFTREVMVKNCLKLTGRCRFQSKSATHF